MFGAQNLEKKYTEKIFTFRYVNKIAFFNIQLHSKMYK